MENNKKEQRDFYAKLSDILIFENLAEFEEYIKSIINAYLNKAGQVTRLTTIISNDLTRNEIVIENPRVDTRILFNNATVKYAIGKTKFNKTNTVYEYTISISNTNLGVLSVLVAPIQYNEYTTLNIHFTTDVPVYELPIDKVTITEITYLIYVVDRDKLTEVTLYKETNNVK